MNVTQPLEGLRVIELTSFIAAPLAGMTLAQLGAEVIRVDPIGGAADYERWPLAASGRSLYWTGLNKGKLSAAINQRTDEGQQLIRRLILESGPGGAIVLTNAAGRDWYSYESLSAIRPDLIHVQVLGRSDGTGAVDYTVNAKAGYPLATGPAGQDGPINHVLPAWDVACGLYAATALVAAVRRRELTGEGTQVTIALEDVALATAANLSHLTEAQVNGVDRERIGNSVYGTYGATFTSRDGVDYMLVALTPRHFTDLAKLTGTADTIADLAAKLGVDFAVEGDRYTHRATLSGLFAVWFRERDSAQVEEGLAATSVLWERYRTFHELATNGTLAANPMFHELEQPGVGSYLAPGLPTVFGGQHVAPVAAPALGDDTAAVLRDRLGMTDDEITQLVATTTVATSEGTE